MSTNSAGKIQDYIQGEYIYIPRREKKTDGNVTVYQRELQKRDANIYLKVLEGISKKELAEKYNLSGSSIRRIVVAQRKEYVVRQEKIEGILSLETLLVCQDLCPLTKHAFSSRVSSLSTSTPFKVVCSIKIS